MLALIQSETHLDDVCPTDSALFPEARSLRASFECLNEARYGIIRGVTGARGSYVVAVAYAGQRAVFDKAPARDQLSQEKLVNMALELETGMLLALHLGWLEDAGRLQRHRTSMGRLNNYRQAIEI